MRKTKIICTIGPAVQGIDKLRGLVKAGMDVARLNCSHGSHEEHALKIIDIKQIRREGNLPLPILIDLKGPEIRCHSFVGGKVELAEGQSFAIHSEPLLGDASRMSVSYSDFHRDVNPGTPILIDDGLIELVVEEVRDRVVHTRVIVGGLLSDRKGVNLPNTPTQLPALSDSDYRDLQFAVEQEVEFVAASFVRSAADVREVRDALHELNGDSIRIIAKIENQQGIDNIDEIIAAADGIMVARGDLGVEIPPERVPVFQKKLIKQCYTSGKISITATQMLDSMIKHTRPTRAEVSDVANAIYDGTSALMLSGETAVGKYPIQAVEMMDRIARSTEQMIDYWDQLEALGSGCFGDVADAISHAAVTTARDLNARAIIVMTYSGVTARMISRFRPASPILAMTISPISRRQLALSWGVSPYCVPLVSSTDAVFSQAMKVALSSGLVDSGDTVVLVGGSTSGTSGTTNT
ncbi:MAG: pyruvate kinase, partial [Clostridiaceae bacterium]|nr:pyruvate kinase [Clostridiaceae bacterium]